jgi:hypothetical protein
MNGTRLIYFLTIVLAFFGARLHAASVTLEIDQSGFANFASTPTNGMTWGIVVDTSPGGTDLSLISDGIGPLTITSDGFLSVDGTVTPDYYFWNDSALTANQTTTDGPPPSFSLGYIGTTGPLTTDENGVEAGDPFGIIWFQSNGSGGDYYGFLTDPSFVLPADGDTLDFSSDISSADKPADYMVSEIPEPSPLTLAFGGLALVCALRAGIAARARVLHAAPNLAS